MPKALHHLRRLRRPNLGIRDSTKPLFVAYVDESGDEGFTRDAAGRIRGTQWFVLSALVVRDLDDLSASRLVDEAKVRCGRPPQKPLHFVDLSHKQRRWLTEELAKRPVQIITHFIDKPEVPGPDLWRFPRLYFLAVLHLLERLTWCVDDMGGQVTIVFSNRAQLPNRKLAHWIRWFCVNRPGCQIRLHALSGTLRSEPHWSHKMLQLADAAASGAAAAVEKDPGFELTEPSYLTALLPRYYRWNQACRGYGASFFPGTPAAGRFSWWDALV